MSAVRAPMSIAALDSYKATKPPDGYSATTRRFYSPIDDVHGVIGALLGSAQHSVVLSMYGFDAADFAKTLRAQLANPRMYVQITLDRSQAGGKTEKALVDQFRPSDLGNSVAIGTSERGAIIHRKMLIVDGVWLLSGSTNWSTSGMDLQDNELTVTFDATACAEARTVLDISHDHALSQMAARKPS